MEEVQKFIPGGSAVQEKLRNVLKAYEVKGKEVQWQEFITIET